MKVDFQICYSVPLNKASAVQKNDTEVLSLRNCFSNNAVKSKNNMQCYDFKYCSIGPQISWSLT